MQENSIKSAISYSPQVYVMLCAIWYYSSLPNRRDVTAINFLRIFHPFQPPRLLKMAQTSHHHAYSRRHVY